MATRRLNERRIDALKPRKPPMTVNRRADWTLIGMLTRWS